MKIIFIPILLLLSSCAAIVGGTIGGVVSSQTVNSNVIQTVVLRSMYEVNCQTIQAELEEFVIINQDIKKGVVGAPNVCQEIKSSEDIFKGCIKVSRENEYRIADGSTWTSFDFYLIQIEKKENGCGMFLYTRLDFDIKGNPFSFGSKCQKGFDEQCEQKFNKAKKKRDSIVSSIQKRSNVVFSTVKEEKIFNFYSNESDVVAFESEE